MKLVVPRITGSPLPFALKPPRLEALPENTPEFFVFNYLERELKGDTRELHGCINIGDIGPLNIWHAGTGPTGFTAGLTAINFLC